MNNFSKISVAACVFFMGYLSGCLVTPSCKTNISPEYYRVISYEKLYQTMANMERNSTLIFDEFPTPLEKVTQSMPGDSILISGSDTLSLVFRDLNREDKINRYPFYIMKDDKNNLWSLFRHNNEFHLTREDEAKHKDWLNYKMERPN